MLFTRHQEETCRKGQTVMIKFFKLHGNRCPDPAATRMVKASQDLMGKKLAQYIKQINGTEEAMLV